MSWGYAVANSSWTRFAVFVLLWRLIALLSTEKFDNVPSGKYQIGLGQDTMAYVGDREDINSMCLTGPFSLASVSFIAHAKCSSIYTIVFSYYHCALIEFPSGESRRVPGKRGYPAACACPDSVNSL